MDSLTLDILPTLPRRELQRYCKMDEIQAWKPVKANAKSQDLIDALTEYLQSKQLSTSSRTSTASRISTSSRPSTSPVEDLDTTVEHDARMDINDLTEQVHEQTQQQQQQHIHSEQNIINHEEKELMEMNDALDKEIQALEEEEHEQEQKQQQGETEQVTDDVSSVPTSTTAPVTSVYDSLMAELDARVADRIASGVELPFSIGKSPPPRRTSTRKLPQSSTFSRFDAVHRRTQQKQKSIVDVVQEREKMKAKLNTPAIASKSRSTTSATPAPTIATTPLSKRRTITTRKSASKRKTMDATPTKDVVPVTSDDAVPASRPSTAKKRKTWHESIEERTITPSKALSSLSLRDTAPVQAPVPAPAPVSVAATPAITSRIPVSRSTITKPVVEKKPRRSTGAAAVAATPAPVVTKVAKPTSHTKFDLASSLAKPIGWKLKTGRVQPLQDKTNVSRAVSTKVEKKEEKKDGNKARTTKPDRIHKPKPTLTKENRDAKLASFSASKRAATKAVVAQRRQSARLSGQAVRA